MKEILDFDPGPPPCPLKKLLVLQQSEKIRDLN